MKPPTPCSSGWQARPTWIKGVGYPKGLLEWADEIGIPGCVGRLSALQGEYGEDRYRASALLRRMARLDEKFYP
jgi:3-hydroxybutyryl-CoA dehydrogenase